MAAGAKLREGSSREQTPLDPAVSMDIPPEFKDGRPSRDERRRQERADSPGPSCVSMRSDWSMGIPDNFKDGCPSREERHQERPMVTSAPSVQQHQTELEMNQEELADTLWGAQVNDERVQSGGVAMETADLKAVQPGPHWLQEYAIYLAGLNLSFLHIGEDSELECCMDCAPQAAVPPLENSGPPAPPVCSQPPPEPFSSPQTPPSFSNSQPPSFSSPQTPPSFSNSQPPPSFHNLEPPPSFSNSQPPSFSSPQTPPSFSNSEPPPSFHNLETPPSFSNSQPPSFSSPQTPPSFSNSQAPSFSNSQPPPSFSDPQIPPSFSNSEPPPSFHNLEPPPSFSNSQPPSFSNSQPSPSFSPQPHPSLSNFEPPRSPASSSKKRPKIKECRKHKNQKVFLFQRIVDKRVLNPSRSDFVAHYRRVGSRMDLIWSGAKSALALPLKIRKRRGESLLDTMPQVWEEVGRFMGARQPTV
ncbi:unnamed protein product [Gadus morhua 'NCC']